MDDKVTFTVRLPGVLNDKVTKLRKQKGLQKNGIIILALEEYVKKNLKEDKE